MILVILVIRAHSVIRDAIFSLQTLVKNRQDQRKNAFIDYEKAFDGVKHTSHLSVLGLDRPNARLIGTLFYKRQKLL